MPWEEDRDNELRNLSHIEFELVTPGLVKRVNSIGYIDKATEPNRRCKMLVKGSDHTFSLHMAAGDDFLFKDDEFLQVELRKNIRPLVRANWTPTESERELTLEGRVAPFELGPWMQVEIQLIRDKEVMKAVGIEKGGDAGRASFEKVLDAQGKPVTTREYGATFLWEFNIMGLPKVAIGRIPKRQRTDDEPAAGKSDEVHTPKRQKKDSTGISTKPPSSPAQQVTPIQKSKTTPNATKRSVASPDTSKKPVPKSKLGSPAPAPSPAPSPTPSASRQRAPKPATATRPRTNTSPSVVTRTTSPPARSARQLGS